MDIEGEGGREGEGKGSEGRREGGQEGGRGEEVEGRGEWRCKEERVN